MLRITQLHQYRKQLEEKYQKLIEKSNDYKHVDESKSDSAAFKAMKIFEKLNKVRYLDKEMSTQ